MIFRSRGPALAGLFLLLAGASMPALAATPASKVFRDWVAGCDNLGACAARSLPADGADQIGFLKLERPAGPAGGMTLSLEFDGEKLPKAAAVTLTLDGAAFPAPGKPLTAKTLDAGAASVTLSEADAIALIAAARKAQKLEARFAGKTYTISLAGAVAAMLWIDERQGRLNTVTALIRKGPNAAETVPAPEQTPVIAARATAALPSPDAATVKSITSRLRQSLKAKDPDGCEDPTPGMPSGDAVMPLSAMLRLVTLSCSAGAYNFGTGFWLLQGSDVAKAQPVVFPEPGGDGSNVLINADYDPKVGEISFFAKGRGIGDCGNSGRFAWTGERFMLAALTDMPECRGIGPDNWLTLFRSEVKVSR